MWCPDKTSARSLRAAWRKRDHDRTRVRKPLGHESFSKTDGDSAEQVVGAQVGPERDLPGVERRPDVGVSILAENADVPRELPEHSASHLHAMGRARIEPLKMLDVQPRSGRHIRLELAIREVRRRSPPAATRRQWKLRSHKPTRRSPERLLGQP